MPYFTIAELRALPDLDDTDQYPDDRLQAATDWIVSIVERECDTSFIEESVTHRLSGAGCDSLRLPDAYVRELTELSVDDIDYDTDQVSAVYVEDGYLYQPFGAYWPTTARGNVSVTYVRGWSTEPPADLKEAMMRGARQWVLTTASWSGADSRSTAINNEWGNIQLSVANADHPTGIPDVDATITGWAQRVRVPKVR